MPPPLTLLAAHYKVEVTERVSGRCCSVKQIAFWEMFKCQTDTQP